MLSKRVTVLLAAALTALMIVVVGAVPVFAAGGSPGANKKHYCVYYRGFHFVSPKQFQKHDYQRYPNHYCKGQAPGVG